MSNGSGRRPGFAVRLLRSTRGVRADLTGRLRGKYPRSRTGAETRLWSDTGRTVGWRWIVKFLTSLQSECLVRMLSVRFLPFPLKVCDMPPLRVLKGVGWSYCAGDHPECPKETLVGILVLAIILNARKRLLLAFLCRRKSRMPKRKTVMSRTSCIVEWYGTNLSDSSC